MDARIALSAAQKLSIDVANMGLRLALLEAEREALAELAAQMKPETWQHLESRQIVQDPDDTTPPETTVSAVIAGDQLVAFQRLLSALRDLM